MQRWRVKDTEEQVRYPVDILTSCQTQIQQYENFKAGEGDSDPNSGLIC